MAEFNQALALKKNLTLLIKEAMDLVQRLCMNKVERTKIKLC